MFPIFRKARPVQGRIQDFFKEGVVSLRVEGKRPRAKGMGEGGDWGGLGLCLKM